MTTSSELFKKTRNWENLQIATFVNHAGAYEIPKMLPVTECPDLDWIGFNYARGVDKADRAKHGLHFYLDDYQFQRLWADPERYIPMLKDFGAVMSPDFSVYSDFPKAVKIWNVYRNMWLACLWQCYGITVIPTIMWGAPDTFEYCFDGFPTDGIVSVSTEGSFASEARRESFHAGYSEMLERLHPRGIIVQGQIPDGLEGNVVGQIQTMTSQIKGRMKANGIKQEP